MREAPKRRDPFGRRRYYGWKLVAFRVTVLVFLLVFWRGIVLLVIKELR